MSSSSNTQVIKVVKATATADDGNVPANAIDGRSSTRWSAQGKGQKLFLDLGTVVYQVNGVDITWYNGSQRTATCDILVDSTKVATSTSSKSVPVTQIRFNGVNGKMVTVVGQGNSVNDWNSITEVKVYGVPAAATGGSGPTPTPEPSTGLDQFGIKMIYPTLEGGRVFNLPMNLPNVRVRAVARIGSSECVSQGDGGETPGSEYWKMDGTWPRMYVYDAARAQKWTNVEMTCYFMKVSPSTNSIAGIVMAARSIHESGGSNAKTYGIKHQYSNNTLSFYKEQVHPTYKFVKAATATIPSNTWLGYKLILRNKSGSGHVVMRVYMDTTDGRNGGDWRLLGTYTDTGSLDGNVPIKDGTSCFVRTDSVTDFRYKRLSIRTIAGEP